MAKKHEKFLQTVLHIYSGEGYHSFLFACLGFLWAFAVTSGQKFADALFILNVGAESLPEVYTLTACGMFVVASVLLYAFHRFESYSIFVAVLFVGIAFYALAFLGITLNSESIPQWFWYALKIAGFFLFSVLMTTYWTFIDQYHHLQDAKRLFSLFSSAIFLGVTATGLTMKAGILDLSEVILFIIVLLFITYLWIRKIVKVVPVVFHEDSEPIRGGERRSSLKHLIHSVITSPFTLFLMASNLLIQLLSVITEYNYLFAFQDYFGLNHGVNEGNGTEANLTLFLGKWLAIVSFGNLIFGLFFYSRLVRRFGIHSLLIITPLILMVSFTGMGMSSSLIFSLMGFIVVEGTLYVIDDSNFNLLLNAVPIKLKSKIRVMIESFFEPIGMLLSASFLALLGRESRWLGLVLSAGLLLVALALRSKYLRALFANLAENAVHFDRTLEDWIRRMNSKQRKVVENKLLGILRSKDEHSQLFASEGLLAFDDPSILPRLLSLVSHMSVPGKVRFLELIEQSSFTKNSLVLETLESWLEDPSNMGLESFIQFYLAKQGLLHPDKVIGNFNNNDILSVGAAIVTLKSNLASLPSTVTSHNQSLAAQYLNVLLESGNEEEVAMGLQILGMHGNNVDILIPYLKNPSLVITKVAAKAIAQAEYIDPIRHAPFLLAYLTSSTDTEIRMACLKALGKTNDSSLVSNIIAASIHFRPSERRLTEHIIFKMGLRTVPTLIAIAKDTQMPDRCRVLAGQILGKLSLPQLRAHLSTIIKVEIDRAYFYFYYSQTIQKSFPLIDLTVLKDILVTNYHSVLDFIIQLLAVAGEIEDEELLVRSLHSRNPKLRSQGIEMLEKTSEPKIFRLLQPLIEDIPNEQKIATYLKRGYEVLSLTALLDKLGESSSQMDRIISAALKVKLDLPNWRESLRQQMLRQDEIFHHFAYELLET